MLKSRASLVGWLAERCQTLFILAGVILVVYAALNGLQAFTTTTFQQKVLEAGYVLGFLGLLGLSVRSVDRHSWQAYIGTTAAILGLIAFSAFTVNNLATLVGLTAGDVPADPVFTAMGLAGFVVGYPAVGVAVLQSDIYSRIVGLLLLVPGIIIILMLAHIAAGLDSPNTVFVVSAGQAMTHLAIGATLNVEAESEEREEGESASSERVRG